MKILIAAGGSGGHLLPAQQLADALPNVEIFFAGHKLDRSPFFQRGRFAFEAIAAAPLSSFAFAKEMIRGVRQSIRLIRRFQPDCVIGFGSYHSFPVLLAASILRKKIVLFEANSTLGKVCRFFAWDADFVAAQFDLGRTKKVRAVPLLPWKKIDLPEKRQARENLGLSMGVPVFLIFGGSQGAQFLNRAIPESLPANAQAIHLAGNDKAAGDVRERYGKAHIPAVVKAFETDMPLLYAAADFVISRSGAGTIAELIRCGLPALLIPFPSAADDHQTANAEFLAKKIGGAKMLCESSADPASLERHIQQLMSESIAIREKLFEYRTECEGRAAFSELILALK